MNLLKVIIKNIQKIFKKKILKKIGKNYKYISLNIEILKRDFDQKN